MRDSERRERAFEQFKKVAEAESRNFAYNVAYRYLVPQFSTAPQSETKSQLCLIEDMARLGHGEATIEVGKELYTWAKENGYGAPRLG